MPLKQYREREAEKSEMSTVKKNDWYVVINDRNILSIDRLLSVIEVYIQDKSTSLILVKVKDYQY